MDHSTKKRISITLLGRTCMFRHHFIAISTRHLQRITYLTIVLQVLAAIGEQFDVGDEICGLVISIRYQEDIISVWTKNAHNQEAKQKIL